MPVFATFFRLPPCPDALTMKERLEPMAEGSGTSAANRSEPGVGSERCFYDETRLSSGRLAAQVEK